MTPPRSLQSYREFIRPFANQRIHAIGENLPCFVNLLSKYTIVYLDSRYRIKANIHRKANKNTRAGIFVCLVIRI